jgi:ribosomal protein S12 methylthiotransferase
MCTQKKNQFMKSKKFHLVSLGCSKNTVDAESMSQLLVGSGYQPTSDPTEAEILIVNTCGFIHAAREESYQVLSELAENKKKRQILVAAGCLSQRYGETVRQRVPEIDGLLGTRRWMDITDIVGRLKSRTTPQPLYHLPENQPEVNTPESIQRFAIQGASAYIKIADGCRRPCAFCAIPLIKGTNVSRPIKSILDEAQFLRDNGILEIILIAQDTTDYGSDLGMKNGLTRLLKELTTAVPDIKWIRVMYAYPGYVTDELIEVFATRPQIIPYLDLPLQHAHPDTLRRMKRPANTEWVTRTLEKIRTALPDIALRTTFIVGFPEETEDEFQTLLDFVQEVRFDRVGVFPFSFEPGTSSEALGDPLTVEIKRERQERLMTLQQKISLEINQALVGNTMEVLIEGRGEIEGSQETIAIGRTYRDAPEIDGMVLIEGNPPIGDMISVRITGASVYDLYGEFNHRQTFIPITEVHSD